ncbi:DUF960 domain-containing protein [Neobacillus sp. MER 74]|uniref:DUF960 family protein n=1 Tax=Neobacillus sp. MER 74 TaxID=2939566 RepID=UPI00203DFF32|nr:DUF960 family protein [Neobacillus sp. MER 74]MCM3116317.1 DUF960 domain-containing protein [Neobacillus sp. MER 74]
MFGRNKRIFMTRAVANEMSQGHLQFIIGFIYEHQEQLTDYFQIFEFYTENDQQWLIQRQEKPDRETTIFVNLNDSKPITRKVWVIDQVDHMRVLFPEDY